MYNTKYNNNKQNKEADEIFSCDQHRSSFFLGRKISRAQIALE